MPTPLTAVPQAATLERNLLIPGDFIRRRALDRLYERKAAVEDLIQALECYERSMRSGPGDLIPFAPVRFVSARVR